MVKKNEKESPRALNEEDLESVTAVVVVPWQVINHLH